MKIAIPLVGPTYTDRSLSVSAQVTRNFYIEVNSESSDPVAFHPFPGLKYFGRAGTGADRGIAKYNGVGYKVTGQTLYSFNNTGAATPIGTISGAGRCVFAEDQSSLVIATGQGKPYTWDETTLTQGTDTSLPSAATVAYINRRVIYDGTGLSFAFADLSAPLTVQSKNVTLAESSPGSAVAVHAYGQKVFLCCTDAIEPWYNSGQGNPPYSRIEGAILNIGVASPYAVASNGNAVYFLGSDRNIYQIVGLQKNPIGNPAIGQAIEKYSDVSEATGMCFSFDNMNFYYLAFNDESWLYNESAGAWTNLAYGVNGARHLMNGYVKVYGKHLVSDYRNGNIYELDFNTYQDSGDVIQRRRDTVKVSGAILGYPGKTIFMSRLELVCERGVGLTTGQGSDPRVIMQYSDDNGNTWSAERWAYLGVQGDYTVPITWFGLGSFKERIFRFIVSDPVKVVLKGLNADISLGAQ